MKRTLIITTIALMAASSAFATGNHTPANPTTPINVTAGSSSSAKSDSSSSSGATANNSLANAFDGSNMYVFPAPVMAAPLPANLCPEGDSMSWSIGWNFFSYARSSTRTEMECLDKVLATIRAVQTPVVQPTLAPLTPAEQKQLACLEQKKPIVQPKKKVVKTCS